ncbi:Oocyte zinc finger protein XlCOF6, partial [Pseudolycoriella hygida]
MLMSATPLLGGLNLGSTLQVLTKPVEELLPNVVGSVVEIVQGLLAAVAAAINDVNGICFCQSESKLTMKFIVACLAVVAVASATPLLGGLNLGSTLQVLTKPVEELLPNVVGSVVEIVQGLLAAVAAAINDVISKINRLSPLSQCDDVLIGVTGLVGNVGDSLIAVVAAVGEVSEAVDQALCQLQGAIESVIQTVSETLTDLLAKLQEIDDCVEEATTTDKVDFKGLIIKQEVFEEIFVIDEKPPDWESTAAHPQKFSNDHPPSSDNETNDIVAPSQFSDSSLRIKDEGDNEATDSLSSFSCKLCGIVLTQKHQMKIHKLEHTGKEPFECDECGKKFVTKSYFKAHKKKHTGGERLTCGKCGMQFVQKSFLEKHVETHLPITCNDCGKKYSQRHKCQRTAYPCDECGKEFRRKILLVHHKISHSVQTPTCVECGKRMNHKGKFQEHRLTYTDNTQFSCNECGKVFASKCQARAHIRNHTLEKRFTYGHIKSLMIKYVNDSNFHFIYSISNYGKLSAHETTTD